MFQFGSTRLAVEKHPRFFAPGGSIKDLATFYTSQGSNPREYLASVAGLGCAGDRQCGRCASATMDENRYRGMGGLGATFSNTIGSTAQAIWNALDAALSNSTPLDYSTFAGLISSETDPEAHNALSLAAATANKGVDEVLNIGPYSSGATGNDPVDVQRAGAADVGSARSMLSQIMNGALTGGNLPQTGTGPTPEQAAALQAQIDASHQSVAAAWLTGAAEGAAAEAGAVGDAISKATSFGGIAVIGIAALALLALGRKL